jgi:hypothetical protein
MTKADLFAINTAAAVVRPDFAPPGGDPQLTAGYYLTGRRFWSGPPGMSEQDVLRAAPPIRDHVDTTLVAAFGLVLSPVGSVDTLPLTRLDPAMLSAPKPVGRAGGGCSKAMSPSPGEPGAVVDIRVLRRSHGGILVGAGPAPAAVLAGRYGDQPLQSLGTVAAGDTGLVALPRDDRRTPWTFRVVSAGDATICGLAR